jgi:dihydroorotate dehydrogenase
VRRRFFLRHLPGRLVHRPFTKARLLAATAPCAASAGAAYDSARVARICRRLDGAPVASLYTTLVRPVLFRLDPEWVHHAAVEACRVAGTVAPLRGLAGLLCESRTPELEMHVAGLRFPNPVGLAAGWDKSARAIRLLDRLGFGFVEIGSISARPSAGNPRPRLFRLPEDRAIIVNYGIPNDGADVVAQRLAQYTPRVPLGVNIVKTNDGPAAPPCDAESILGDYAASASRLQRHASYLAVNLSCPNTEGDRDFFSEPGNLHALLERLASLPLNCPVFLKLAPRPDPAAVERVLEQCDPFDFVRGFLINLPPGKPATLRSPRAKWESLPGAVSGKPFAPLADACLRELYRRMPRGRYAIIGGGGVFTAEDAYAKIRLGASLVQVYTALVYEGLGVVKRINRGLSRLLARDGFSHLSEAVGIDVAEPVKPRPTASEAAR